MTLSCIEEWNLSVKESLIIMIRKIEGNRELNIWAEQSRSNLGVRVLVCDTEMDSVSAGLNILR